MAVKAYGEAVKDFPTAPAASVFTAAKDAIIAFIGRRYDPFTPLKKFGEMKLNKEQIVSNSAAVVAYGNAIKGLCLVHRMQQSHKGSQRCYNWSIGGLVRQMPFAPMVKIRMNREN